jgi:hypothetical protein
MSPEFVLTDADVIQLHELPQKLLDLARNFDKERSTHLLIDVNLLGQIPRSLLRLLQRCYCCWHERLST